MKNLTVYQRLVRAARDNKALRLSPADVFQLGRMDEAISSRAEQDDEEDAMDKLEAEEFVKSMPQRGVVGEVGRCDCEEAHRRWQATGECDHPRWLMGMPPQCAICNKFAD